MDSLFLGALLASPTQGTVPTIYLPTFLTVGIFYFFWRLPDLYLLSLTQLTYLTLPYLPYMLNCTYLPSLSLCVCPHTRTHARHHFLFYTSHFPFSFAFSVLLFPSAPPSLPALTLSITHSLQKIIHSSLSLLFSPLGHFCATHLPVRMAILCPPGFFFFSSTHDMSTADPSSLTSLS